MSELGRCQTCGGSGWICCATGEGVAEDCELGCRGSCPSSDGCPTCAPPDGAGGTGVETYKPNDPYRPFSNGTEHMWWLESNCCRGEKGCRKYRPEATSSRHGCPIEVAVALASMTDGKIPARIALRGGWLIPGSNGELVEDTDPRGRVIPVCPEFRGYDEPDDRPRRSPRPPEGQLDLLDPRNGPERAAGRPRDRVPG